MTISEMITGTLAMIEVALMSELEKQEYIYQILDQQESE
jgi:hypothetical protein